MSRPLHPLACRIGRAERAQIVAFARAQGVSVSMLLKTALRNYLASQPAYPTQPPVYAPVNGLSDSLSSSPPLLRPYPLTRKPGSTQASALLRRGARDRERKGLLSDTAV
jgi:hypothetical protein